ncbi:MAG: hypothetical protein WC708_12625 [Lentisphaeria bacterium]
MEQQARQVFRQPPSRLNCAQAVASAWAAKTGQRTRLVEELAGCGGGGAPGGVCGALHAVQRILADGAARKQAETAFAAAAGGALDCRGIRNAGVACVECVGFAAGWLERHLGGQKKAGNQ